MRVITGSARGCRLNAIPGEDTRPTSARVKEAIFSIIQFDIEGRRVLDLFAGTGQMGIEALSRGAAEAVFVDNGRAAQQVIRDNLARTKLESRGKVVCSDAVAYLSAKPAPFDIVFLDPPYQSKLLVTVLEKIAIFDILRAGGIIVCETEDGFLIPELPAPYEKGRTYRYGTQQVSICRRNA